MSDYIKREDALKAVNGIHEDDLPRNNKIEVCDVITLVPSADVAPVRHGRWIVGEQMPMHDIKGNLSWGNWYTCNQCEFKTYAIERHITQYNYCPNCGAKMDEGEDNED